MNKTVERRKIKILGTICNFISQIFTIFLCLPLPIVFFFLNNIKRNFSVLDSFENYLKDKISVEKLENDNKNIFYRLIFLTVIFLIIIFFLISENNNSDLDTKLNTIFISSIFLMLSFCYYLYFVVNNYIKHNLTV